MNWLIRRIRLPIDYHIVGIDYWCIFVSIDSSPDIGDKILPGREIKTSYKNLLCQNIQSFFAE